MAAFSSDPEVSLRTTVNVDSSIHFDDFINSQELKFCLEWIKKGDFKKVCLQFPDSLLVNSIDIALFIERDISQKTYILGDTSYGSCCVDEIAAEHVNGDAIIHFGHACLSPVSKLPVFYVFPKDPFDVPKFYSDLQAVQNDGALLILYNISFAHIADALRDLMPEEMKQNVVVSELNTKEESRACGCWCNLLTEGNMHKCLTLSRFYCTPEDKGFSTVVYLGDKSNPNLKNFLCLMKDTRFLSYYQNKFEAVSDTSIFSRCSYLVERLKGAQNIGILVGTLGVKGYLEAIEHVKKLCHRFKKKTYVVVVGKPSPAKLANFPEMDIFVTIACAEAEFGERKDYIQPIVGLFEVELAFNENRTWSSSFSRYFRDLLPGGNDYIACPDEEPDDNPSASLVSNKGYGTSCTSDSTDLVIRQDLQVGLTNTSFVRTWNGLDRTSNETEAALAEKGRSGVASVYKNEMSTDNSFSTNE